MAEQQDWFPLVRKNLKLYRIFTSEPALALLNSEATQNTALPLAKQSEIDNIDNMLAFTTITLISTTFLASVAAAIGVAATPHNQYSSSVGVLGCHINTDRVAYWPEPVDCNNICVKLSYGGRSLHLLRVDQSGGAYDVSYDAWNYLLTGRSAKDAPTTGGAISMDYVDVPASECADLLHTAGNKLPLSAPNSMNYLSSCLGQSGSWVANHYVLYNILNPVCTRGHDETCSLNWPAQNQATCPHPLGDPAPLTSAPVYNIQYPSGQVVLAQ
ncbi:hypothetical protein VTK73DRAFT_3630 [Phialemonium thermophilum]|uniref:Cerato-platanin n=1 Tax=Phialemonium thermophilum TaxID=223376 RepID=A0ABR3WY41_9PEZI